MLKGVWSSFILNLTTDRVCFTSLATMLPLTYSHTKWAAYALPYISSTLMYVMERQTHSNPNKNQLTGIGLWRCCSISISAVYGAECWTLRKEDKHRILRAEIGSQAVTLFQLKIILCFPQCIGQTDRPTDTSFTGKFDNYRPLRSESDAA